MFNANAFAKKTNLHKVNGAGDEYQFSLKLDYIPSTYYSALNWLGESGQFTNGAGLTFEGRGDNLWGFQGFSNYRHIGKIEVLALGGNAVYHFRDDFSSKIDPYLLIGGQILFAVEGSNSDGFIPVMNIGSGVNFALTKHLGFHVDAIASPLVLILPLIILEGRAGIVITF